MAHLYIFSDSFPLIRPEYSIGLFNIFINNFRTRLLILASGASAPGNLLGHRPPGGNLQYAGELTGSGGIVRPHEKTVQVGGWHTPKK